MRDKGMDICRGPGHPPTKMWPSKIEFTHKPTSILVQPSHNVMIWVTGHRKNQR